MTIGDLRIDFDKQEVYLEGELVALTRIEYELLCLLARHKVGEINQQELFEVIGSKYGDVREYLWVNVSRLRHKLKNTI